jgi:hypothetical protein
VPPNAWDGADRQKRHALCKEKNKGRAAFASSSSQALGAMKLALDYAEHYGSQKGSIELLWEKETS